MIFNKNYFILAVLIFIVEVVIALYVKDQFVRPYLGDVLVVILIYCFCMTFLRLPVVATALGVLTFAFLIEFLQYFRMIEILGLEKSTLARTVIGTSFAVEDLLAYVAGIGVVLVVEKYRTKKYHR